MRFVYMLDRFPSPEMSESIRERPGLETRSVDIWKIWQTLRSCERMHAGVQGKIEQRREAVRSVRVPEVWTETGGCCLLYTHWDVVGHYEYRCFSD